MQAHWLRTGRLRLAAVLAATVIGVVGVESLTSGAPQGKSAAESKYIGSAKCKNCHTAEATGGQFKHWKESKHAQAFANLATPAALEAGKAKGVAEPQKSEQCVKCHTTGFGLPADRFAKGFDPKEGVQCETCHGPGDKHMKARMMAAAEASGEEGADKVPPRQTLPADEIIGKPAVTLCLECHNKQSPTYKHFCFKKRQLEISHFDPRKARTPAELEAYKCACTDQCTCTDGLCKPEGGGK